MQSQDMLHDRRFIIALSITSIFALISLIIFLFGANTVAAFLGNYTTPLVAILNTGLAILFWRYVKEHKSTEKIFRWFATGFALWAIAEAIWLIFVLLEQDPYPSIADLFWVVGYIPLILALLISYQTLRVRPSTQHLRIIYAIIFVAFSITAYYIFLPIIQDYAPGLFLVSLLNMAYPLLDFVILSQVLFLFFIVGKSRFNIPWFILSIGFAVTVLADLGFSFADWNGLYDVEQGNMITRMVDWAYLINHPLLSLGIYTYYLVFQRYMIIQKAPVDILPTTTPKITNTNIVFFINKDNLVFDLSDNFLTLMQTDDKEQYVDRSLDEVLGQETNIFEKIIKKLSEQGYITDVPLQLKDAENKTRDAWLSGIAINLTRKFYSGATIAIRTHVKGAIPNDGLSEYNKSIVRNIFDRAFVQLPNFSAALRQYFSAKIQMLLGLVEEYNGDIVAKSIASSLNKLSSENNWQIKISLQEIWVAEIYQIKDMLACFPLILETAHKETIRLTSKAIVAEEIKGLDAQMDPVTLAIVKDYDLG